MNDVSSNPLLLRLSNIGELLRFKPFDSDSESGRSKERYRRIIFTAVTALGSKAFALAVMLISVPLTLNYLGPEKYGTWMTISSFLAALSFADLGISNGLINLVSAASGHDDERGARRAISCAWFALWGVAAVFGIAFLVIWHWVDWGRVLNVRAAGLSDEVGLAVAACMVCFLVGLPLGVPSVTQRGLQEGFANNIWLAVGNLLAFLLLLVGVAIRASLPLLVVLLMGGPLVANLLNHLVLFYWRHKRLSPSMLEVTWPGVKSIVGVGFMYLCLQIAGALGFASPNLVVSHTLGPAYVPILAIPQRLYSVVPIFLSMFNSALWPAFGDAIARGDHGWVKRTLCRSISASVSFAAVPCCILAFGGALIMRYWVGDKLSFPPGLFWALSLWTLISAATGPISAFLNGAHVVRFQVITALSFGAVQLPLSIVFARRQGVQGIVWAMVLTYTVTALAPYCVTVPRVLRHTQGKTPSVRESDLATAADACSAVGR